MERVNYIAAFYIGNNRGYEHYKRKFASDPLFFVNKHVEFLNSCNDKRISLVTFVFNDDISNDVLSKLASIKLHNYELQIVVRKNSGFSYGIWNDTITQNLDKADYFFLIEDDYVPCDTDFCSKFIEFVSDETPYICGFADKVTDVTAPNITAKGIYTVPSISNGMIKSTACKEVFGKYGTIFKLNQNNDYPSAWDNQICFYTYFFEMGYGMADILSKYSSPFLYCNGNQMKIFGDAQLPSLIMPIAIYG